MVFRARTAGWDIATPPAEPLLSRAATRFRTARTQPEFPLALLFVGYPLWWVLGVVQLVLIVVTVMMARSLVRNRPLRVPAGFGWWALFLVWAAAGGAVVQVYAPGSLAGENANRLFTWAVRYLWYVEATVVLLYVADTRKRLSTMRVTRILAAMFVTVVLGGVAGVLLPTLNVHSVIELGLPQGLRANAFVHSQVHAYLAERQVYLGDVQYRPSGPFPFANEWGVNFACFLPFFLFAWFGKDAGWREYVGPGVLAVGLLPVIYSLNRGLWAILILNAVLFVVTMIWRGRARGLLVPLAVGLPIVLLLALGPLGQAVTSRFEGHNSNLGRSTLSFAAVEGMARSSPVFGLGTTRPYEGTFYSIAGGSTTDCPSCTPPALGTQGLLWLLLFGHGLLGAFFSLAFFISTWWRNRRSRAQVALPAQAALLSFILTAAIYDWSTTTTFAVMIGAGLVAAEAGTSTLRRLSSLWPGTRRVIVWCLIGALCGALWQFRHGTTYDAQAGVWLPQRGSIQLDRVPTSEMTLDSESRFLFSRDVEKAIGHDRAVDRRAGRGHLSVSAVPNTRILLIRYSSTDPERAHRVVEDAAEALLTAREERLTEQRDLNLAALERELAEVSDSLGTLAAVGGGQPTTVGQAITQGKLRDRRLDLLRETADLQQQVQTQTTPVRAGKVTDVVVTPRPQQWNVAVLSGLLLGLLVAVVLDRISRRRARARGGDLRPDHYAGLPAVEWRDDPERVRAALSEQLGGAGIVFHAADPRDVIACTVALELAHSQTGRHAKDAGAFDVAVLVGSMELTTAAVAQERERLGRQGLRVVAFVTVAGQPNGTPEPALPAR